MLTHTSIASTSSSTSLPPTSATPFCRSPSIFSSAVLGTATRCWPYQLRGELQAHLQARRPTVVAAVRLYEKFQPGAGERQSRPGGGTISPGRALGRRAVRQQPERSCARARYPALHLGGAPLSAEIARFSARPRPVVEGYGLTESLTGNSRGLRQLLRFGACGPSPWWRRSSTDGETLTPQTRLCPGPSTSRRATASCQGRFTPATWVRADGFLITDPEEGSHRHSQQQDGESLAAHRESGAGRFISKVWATASHRAGRIVSIGGAQHKDRRSASPSNSWRCDIHPRRPGAVRCRGVERQAKNRSSAWRGRGPPSCGHQIALSRPRAEPKRYSGRCHPSPRSRPPQPVGPFATLGSTTLRRFADPPSIGAERGAHRAASTRAAVRDSAVRIPRARGGPAATSATRKSARRQRRRGADQHQGPARESSGAVASAGRRRRLWRGPPAAHRAAVPDRARDRTSSRDQKAPCQ